MANISTLPSTHFSEYSQPELTDTQSHVGLLFAPNPRIKSCAIHARSVIKESSQSPAMYRPCQ